jgi:hypothetical protein
MAIIIRGKTKCPICDRSIDEGDEVVSFPSLISNENEPLYGFNDAAFHAGCFASHPLASAATQRIQQWQAKTSQGRVCRVCGADISDPDDYYIFPHFTDDPQQPLFDLNYGQFHRSCLDSWDRLPSVICEIRRLRESGSWGGTALDSIVRHFSR